MPKCCADIVIDYENLWHFSVRLTLDVFVICRTLSGVNCGKFWYFGTPSGVNCRKFWYFGSTAGDNCGIFLYFRTLSCVNCRKFWYFLHSFLKVNTSTDMNPWPTAAPSRYSTNCTTDSLQHLYIKRDTAHKPETWDRRHETGDVGQEMWDRRKETWDKRHETGDVRRETGNVSKETWDRKHETGDVRQET